MGVGKGKGKKGPIKIDNWISWFEIPALNFDQALLFYNTLYSIKMETAEANGFVMAFFPSDTGIGGAIVCGPGSTPSDSGSLIYLNGGEDLNFVLNRVESAGGRVVMPKTKINDDAGYFGIFIDTEGNKIALHSNN
jgi:predicted enzyme related to lactoylglutathione lyase